MSHRDFVVIKVLLDDSLRRFVVEHPAQEHSFAKLKDQIAHSFQKELRNAHDFGLVFVDDEGDHCIMSSDLELAEAVSCSVREGGSMRLLVQNIQLEPASTPEPMPEPTPEPTPEPASTPEPSAVEEKQEKSKATSSDDVEDDIEDENLLPVVLTLLLDFLETPAIVAEIPTLLQRAVALLPTATTTAGAQAMLETLLAQVPAVRDHQLTQLARVRMFPKVSQVLPLVASSPAVLFVSVMLPQVLQDLPKVLSALPTIINDILIDLPENTATHCTVVHAKLKQHLLPLLAGLGGAFQGMHPMMMGLAGLCAKAAPVTPAPTSASDPASHVGISCDHCGVKPIQGSRFKCTVCHDFDLCMDCEAKDVHPAEHALLKIKQAPRNDIHRGVRCDGCGLAPITGARFKCQVCPNFDLCATCEAKDEHPAEHALLKMKVAAAGRRVRARGCPLGFRDRRSPQRCGGRGLGELFSGVAAHLVRAQAHAQEAVAAPVSVPPAASTSVQPKGKLGKAEKTALREAKHAEKAAKQAEQHAGKQAKRAEKEAKQAEKTARKQAKQAEKQAKQAEKQAKRAKREAKQAEKQAKQAEKAARKQAKQAEKLAKKSAKQEASKQRPRKEPKQEEVAPSQSHPVPEVKAESTEPVVVCRQNHPMASFATYHGDFFCDDCKTKFSKGATLFGCRKCDFDLCPECVLQASSRVASPVISRQVSVQEPSVTHQQPQATPELLAAKEEKHDQAPEPVASVPQEVATPAADPDLARFSEELATLAKIGWEEQNLNLYLLKRHGGVLSQVINWYLDNAQ